LNPPETFSQPPIALTIAGFDPSNGAGVTADLQVFSAHGLFGTSAITALTSQSTVGVASVSPVDAADLRHSLDHLTGDMPPAGIKIGMLKTAPIVSVLAAFLEALQQRSASHQHIPIVIDPALVSSSGMPLLDRPGIEALRSQLLPKVSWLTPNWAELAKLTDREVRTPAEATEALHLLGRRFPHLHIVATGGDTDTPTDLLRLPSGELHTFPGHRVDTTSTHGTGCAFSSALLSRLILGDAPTQAVAAAKTYVEGALRHAPGLGAGRGPMDLLWNLRS
jgi:hydroxymethylpyrimidine/phosphomethylpyrimidine kinase